MIKLTKPRPQDHQPALADDLLDGAKAFAQHIYGKTDQRTMRRMFHELSQGYWPATKVSARYVGRKSAIDARLSSAGAA